MVWNSTDDYLKGWLCSQYDCCTAMDMRTLAALPDLLKHTEKFIKYFHLHFFNNESDFPPQHCSIDYQVAISAESPNLIQAVQVLLQKQYSTRKLSFIELSYLIHLISDLHQPLHGNSRCWRGLHNHYSYRISEGRLGENVVQRKK